MKLTTFFNSLQFFFLDSPSSDFSRLHCSYFSIVFATFKTAMAQCTGLKKFSQPPTSGCVKAASFLLILIVFDPSALSWTNKIPSGVKKCRKTTFFGSFYESITLLLLPCLFRSLPLWVVSPSDCPILSLWALTTNSSHRNPFIA